jgi:hypothetical protein
MIAASGRNVCGTRDADQPSFALAERLRECKVLVRHFRQLSYEQRMHIDVATPCPCHRLIAVLNEIRGTAS